MGAFLRTAIDDNNLIRGAARLIAAPITAPYPTSPGSIGQMIALPNTSVNDVQTLTMTGSPTGGTYTLTNTSNSVGTLGANTGNVNLYDTSALTIGTAGGTTGVTLTGTLALNDTGAISDPTAAVSV